VPCGAFYDLASLLDLEANQPPTRREVKISFNMVDSKKDPQIKPLERNLEAGSTKRYVLIEKRVVAGYLLLGR
jgi:hypothetical protein